MSNAINPGIVTHFIAGFPTYEASLDVARGLIAGGAFALEMQIPFSDPNADGPVIEEACRQALDAGFKVADAWKLLEAIRAESDIPVFVMSYASLVFTPGVENFVRRAKDSGATGLIIPDLVPGADEGLYAAASAAGCPAVPVVIPWISDKRLDEVLSENLDWIYVALRSGITGTYTELGPEQEAFLSKLRRRGAAAGSGLRIMAGFGIQDAAQVEAVVKMADAAIVGSALVTAIIAAGVPGAGDAARSMVEMLRGSS
ncbi:MAG: tryptophan synthase subunit alpha [Spirochaetaceae bacterium]|nr:tryptophan synthase subunit alpha [Spirochaetaceae bacterium]